MVPETRKEWPENCTFPYFGQTMEDRVVDHMEAFVLSRFDPTHFSLHIDGIMVNGEGVDKDCGIIDMLQDHVHKSTGIWSARTTLRGSSPLCRSADRTKRPCEEDDALFFGRHTVRTVLTG